MQDFTVQGKRHFITLFFPTIHTLSNIVTHLKKITVRADFRTRNKKEIAELRPETVVRGNKYIFKYRLTYIIHLVRSKTPVP